MKIQDCVALVTGAASGIGRAVAGSLLEKGGSVLLVDWNEEAGEAVCSEFCDKFAGRCKFQKCDVADSEQLKDTFERAVTEFGKLNVVISNAGIVLEETPAKMVDINFKAGIESTRLGIEYMSKTNGKDGGIIIYTSSQSGLRAFPMTPYYSACKFGLVGLTGAYASPLHSSMGIRFNCICPSLVDTAMVKKVVKIPASSELTEQILAAPRLQPEQVAVEYIRLIEDDSKNGMAVDISLEESIDVEIPTIPFPLAMPPDIS